MTPCGHLRRLASAAFYCVAHLAACAALSSRPRSPFFAHPRIQAIGVWALLSLSIWSTEFSSSSSGGRPRALATPRCTALREGVSASGTCSSLVQEGVILGVIPPLTYLGALAWLNPDKEPSKPLRWSTIRPSMPLDGEARL